tara:strand:- start:15262 stop:16719 length:1458 start_codon:yes stop_codon:yes gene_type:complete
MNSFYTIPIHYFIGILIGIILFMLIIIRPNKGNEYGSAKWGDKSTVKKLKLNGKNGIVLGLYKGQKLILDEPLSVLVLAPPGTGKTSAIAIPTALSSKHSLVIHDPKGEQYEITAKVRKKFSNIIYFNPTDKESDTFNVFDKKLLPADKLDWQGYVTNISHILIKEDKNGKNYFTKAARNAFSFFALWLLWKHGETSIPEVRDQLLISEDIADTIENMLSNLNEGNPSNDDENLMINGLIKDAKATLVPAESDDQWNGVMGTLTDALQVFSDPRIAKATTGKSNIDANQLKKEITTIYLVVPDKDKDRISPIMAMLFETVATQLISEPPFKNQIPITFIMDEFIRLGYMKIIKDLPAISRSYKLNTIFIAQSYNQIAEIYGRDSIGTFNSNCAYKVIFQQNDPETAESIAKTIGTHTRDRKSHNASSKTIIQTQTSESTSKEARHLLTAQGILNINSDECIILGQGQLMHPIKAKCAFWFCKIKT